MTTTILAPANGQTLTPNPISVHGTTDPTHDALQIRWERFDGTVWNGNRWADDATVWRPPQLTESALVANVNTVAVDRLDDVDARFIIEWHGTLSAGSGDTRILAAHQGAWSFGIDPDNNIVAYFETDAGQVVLTGTTAAIGEAAYRLDVDATIQAPDEAVVVSSSTDRGVTWQPVPMAVTSGLWSSVHLDGITTGDRVVVGAGDRHGTIGTLDHDSTVRAFRYVTHNGARLVDLDMSINANANHDLGLFIADSAGVEWAIVGGSIERDRADRWITVVNESGKWRATSPDRLEPVGHSINARPIINGHPGDIVSSSFTPYPPADNSVDRDRYIRRGTARVYWAEALADPSSPTVAEILDAHDLTCDLTGQIAGLDPLFQVVDKSHVWSDHDRAVVGVAPAQQPTLTLLDRNNNGLTTRSLFAAGRHGYLILAPYGQPDVGDRVDVIACQTAGTSDSWGFGIAPATITARLAATGATVEAIVNG